MTSPSRTTIRIIACGSPLMGDDAIGLLAARALKRHLEGSGVEIVEAGTPGLSLLNILEDTDAAIILDAICSGSSPGTLHCFSADNLPARELFPLSLHQFNIVDALTLGRLTSPEKLPARIIVLGIEIEDLRPALSVSPAVSAALPNLVQRVLEVLRELGVNLPEH
ncbi:MAG: hydrogenase maturation protease [Chloroflexota bacterium]|nr:MAG: hydrogenase maturation protease [Chloroflexota bacterium]